MILGEMRHRTQRKLRWKQCNPEVVEEKGGLGICGVPYLDLKSRIRGVSGSLQLFESIDASKTTGSPPAR